MPLPKGGFKWKRVIPTQQQIIRLKENLSLKVTDLSFIAGAGFCLVRLVSSCFSMPTTLGSLLTNQPLLWVRHFYDVLNKHSVTVQLKCSAMAWCLNFRAPVAKVCLVVFS